VENVVQSIDCRLGKAATFGRWGYNFVDLTPFAYLGRLKQIILTLTEHRENLSVTVYEFSQKRLTIFYCNDILLYIWLAILIPSSTISIKLSWVSFNTTSQSCATGDHSVYWEIYCANVVVTDQAIPESV